MKQYRMVPTIILSISVSMLLLNIAFLLFNIIEPINMDFIWLIITFAVLSLVIIFMLGKSGKRISEAAARFKLDALPGEQMVIDTGLNSGVINEQEAKSRKNQLQQELDLVGALNGGMGFIKRISIIIFLLVSCVSVLFIIGNIIDMKLVGDIKFINVIICGIISQLVMSGLIVFNIIITTRCLRDSSTPINR